MKDFVALEPEQQQDMLRCFPNVVLVNNGEEHHGYKMISLSVFDHWLNEEESLNYLQDVSSVDDQRWRELLFCLSKKIIASERVLTFKVEVTDRETEQVEFRSFVDENAALRYVQPSPHNISSDFYFRLALPDRCCLFFEGADYTSHLYYKDDEDISSILEFARQCGIYALSD